MSKVCSLADEKAHRGATTVWLNQNAVKLIGLFVGDNTDVTNLVFFAIPVHCWSDCFAGSNYRNLVLKLRIMSPG